MMKVGWAICGKSACMRLTVVDVVHVGGDRVGRRTGTESACLRKTRLTELGERPDWRRAGERMGGEGKEWQWDRRESTHGRDDAFIDRERVGSYTASIARLLLGRLRLQKYHLKGV